MSNGKVNTVGRLAQWKIVAFESYQPQPAGRFGSYQPTNYNHRTSDPFKMGIWNWYLAARINRICLFPQQSEHLKEKPPFVRFITSVTTSGPNRQRFTSKIHEGLLQKDGDFAFSVGVNLHGDFVVEVEFLDLKIGEGGSIWLSECTMQHPSFHKCLSRMLKESIHMDVTINASDGTLRAHKAILCSSSPVFESMFKHDLKEKKSSTVDIQDMSSESCMAMLSFMYCCISGEELWKHRMALLGAANKYDIAGLKDACEESLSEDINTENVLERLQEASLYRLQKLKEVCMVYLLDFGKIYDVVKDEMCRFFREADREIVEELFQRQLAVSKPS